MIAELPTSFTALSILLLSTAGVAVLHTLAGPDHYLPFIVLGKARKWTTRRIILWTVFCGLGHVASSVVIAFGAVALGQGLERVQVIEEFRGNLAAWAMIAFGAVYFAWGVNHALHRRMHAHDGDRGHDNARAGSNPTPWILFTIFVLGPCEPMIPLVMYPAAQERWGEMWGVASMFTLLTIGSMVATVLLAVKGLRLLPLRRIETYTHAIAGAVVLSAGCAIQFFGL